ncbi:helix-turn-helix domain-containing protein [Methylobacterium sp. J-076]|uniref:helix-turn-helix domain-containing protein n=1 Tax=Methylobacterium sp. J-076 TaxID=2836655 RepID=UPI001FBAAB20|nr:helix-turn-helix domain-containing protein [Methylobacterium sp. J-076]MCJ2012152.1 helix-turn-helix domain-containing protein [Methylobacterium sp. J-076]
MMDQQIQPFTYRPKYAARMLGVSRSTLYQMIAEHRLKVYKLEAATIIRYDDLMRLVDGAEPTSATAARRE